ncbi:hypothetical protein EW026_g866 [Hermanssonia centrifuga]|uniref:Uncharacterized protein n=1 Tax=Hermanssonia centrifuga TaxID=98765 RepID=A0A4V3XBF5_9APHY|nr:hypothetical protein EW026_g866 [Hermanssonia centrifuga]
MGYTSVFVHYPKTPFTPDMNKHISSPILPQSAAPPSPSKASSRGLKHFRSLTALKPSRRARSRAPPSPPLSAKKTSVETRRARAQSIMNSKKLKYSKALPAPLGNELALAQLMDGGKLEAHVKCFAENQAKAVGAVKVNGQLVGVGDVWRDEQGGIWMDQDEEWEFTHLLGEDDFSMHSGDWIRFDSPSAQENKSRSVTAGDEHRRSLSTQDSDLSPRYAMNAESESQDDLAVFGSILAPTVLRKPGMSVLSIPARSRRSAKHLRKPEFLLNVFPIPLSPQANDSSTSPRIAAFHVGKVRPQGQKARRRPAPLTLVPLTPGLKRPTNPADPDQIRQDFLLDSFAPRPRTSSVQPLTPLNRDTSGYHPRTTSRPSLMSMKSFFKARSAKKVTAA